jgi:hypothetical protein
MTERTLDNNYPFCYDSTMLENARQVFARCEVALGLAAGYSVSRNCLPPSLL